MQEEGHSCCCDRVLYILYYTACSRWECCTVRRQRNQIDVCVKKVRLQDGTHAVTCAVVLPECWLAFYKPQCGIIPALFAAGSLKISKFSKVTQYKHMYNPSLTLNI